MPDFAALAQAQPIAPFGNLSPLVLDAIARLLQAALVLVVTLSLARWSRNAFLRASVRSKAHVNTRYLVARLLSLGVLFIGLATILAIFDVPLSAVVTFVGVVGLAISLAMQDILKNFFAGLYLLFERPFRIGDVIRVRDFAGSVEDIGIRTTTLRTPENVQILIPNAVVFAEVVLNRTDATGESAAPSSTPGALAAPAPVPQGAAQQGETPGAAPSTRGTAAEGSASPDTAAPPELQRGSE